MAGSRALAVGGSRSRILNSGGTQVCYLAMQNWPYLEEIGFQPDGYYAAARVFVSLLVGWFWNFILQRYFVFRHSNFDPYAIRFVDSLLPRRRRELIVNNK